MSFDPVMYDLAIYEASLDDESGWEEVYEQEKLALRKKRLYSLWGGIENRLNSMPEDTAETEAMWVRHEKAFQAYRAFEIKLKTKK